MTTALATPNVRTPRTSVLRRHVPAVVALGWVLFVAASVILAPLLFPAGPLIQDLGDRFSLPSPVHPLGTDDLGRDLLARLAYGGQPTLLGVVVGVLIAVGIGAPLGLVAGYFGRWVDRALSFGSDILMAVPFLLIVLLAFAIFPNDNVISMAIFGLFASSAIFRIVRGATLTVAGELYIVAARATGLSHLAVLVRHVAPRLAALVQVQVSVVAAIALSTQVGLGFLGLDVAAPRPSWGGMIADASKTLFLSLWPLVPPTAAIVLTILALGVLGDLGQERSAARSTVSFLPRRPSDPNVIDPPAISSLLSVRGLSVQAVREGRSELLLVQDVSFEVAAGEIVGLVGESGAGKSVTARAILGINGNTRTTGSAFFDGVDLLAIPESELRKYRGAQVAFIGQDPMSSLDPLYRVESQLIEALRTHHRLSRKAARARMLELLADVRIPDPAAVARRYPFELSGGMAQRVSIAIALAGEPRVLIADEPTTALDVTVQMEVLGLLKRLSRDRGLAIILVTHDWGVVADMCARAVTMYGGEVVEAGSVQEVFDSPRNPYTYALRKADPHLQPVGTLLASIPGTVPAPGSWPLGCRFAERCAFVTDACRASHPPLAIVGEGRLSRCIRVDELRKVVDNGRV